MISARNVLAPGPGMGEEGVVVEVSETKGKEPLFPRQRGYEKGIQNVDERPKTGVQVRQGLVF